MFKTKLMLSLFGIALCLSMVQCKKSLDENGQPIYDYIPAKADKSDKWGMINSKGEFLFEDEFEKCPSAVVNGYFTVEEKKGIAVYKADKKPEVVDGLEKLKDAGVMMDGIMPIVRENERIKFVNKKGEEQFELKPIKGQEVVRCSAYPVEGLIKIELANDKYGFVNTKGEVVIDPKYDDASVFVGKYAVVGTKKENTNDSTGYTMRWSLIDKKGDKVFDYKESMRVVDFRDGKSIVEKDDKYSVLDNKGEVIKKLPAKVYGISGFDGNNIIFFDEDYQCGVINLNGEIIIKPKYESIVKAGKNYVCQKEGDKEDAVILNTKGEEVGKIDDVEHFGYVEGFGIFAEVDDEWTLFDTKGKEKIENTTFYSVDAECPYEVRSDYFDASAVATQLCNAVVSGEGFTDIGVKIGARADQIDPIVNGNLYDYKYKSTLELDGLEIPNIYSGENKNLVQFDADIVDTYYEDYYSYYGTDRINPYATVVMYGSAIQLPSNDKAQSVYKACISKLEKSGFTQESLPYEVANTFNGETVAFRGKTSGVGYLLNCVDDAVTLMSVDDRLFDGRTENEQAAEVAEEVMVEEAQAPAEEATAEEYAEEYYY